MSSHAPDSTYLIDNAAVRRDREKWVSTFYRRSEFCTKRTKQHPTGAQRMAGVGRKVLLMIISPRPLLKVRSMAAGCSGPHQPCLGSLYRLRLLCLHGKPVPVFNQPQWFKKSHIQQEFSQKQQYSDHEHLFVDFCKQCKVHVYIETEASLPEMQPVDLLFKGQ